MRSLPRWLVWSLFLAILGGVIFVTQRFAQETPVIAEGDLLLEAGLEPHVDSIRKVFVVFHSDEEVSPDSPAPRMMPLGAMQLKLQSAPQAGEFLHFVATENNIQMMGGNTASWPKRLRIKARLDTTGEGGVDKPGDVTGEIRGVAPGTRGLKITLNRLIPSS